MRRIAAILASTALLATTCAQEPRTEPPPAAEPSIPGEPVLAIPGLQQAPPPPPELAPPVGDAGVDTPAVEEQHR